MKKIIALIFVSMLISCAAAPIIPQQQKYVKASFTIGEVNQKTVGEPMVEQIDAIVAISDGFRAMTEYQIPAKGILKEPAIHANTLFKVIAQKPNGDLILQSDSMGKQVFLGTESDALDLCILATPSGEPYGDTNCLGTSGITWRPKPQNFLKSEKIYTYLEGSFKQELVYNGKSKDMLKLQYREYKDDFARAAFYQDLIYDLTESTEIGFRGMLIEVVEATNSYIKFIVKKPMTL